MTAPLQHRTSSEEPRVTRILNSGLETALQHFADPEVLASGKVCVLALDAVVERFGGRWSIRREHVHDHVTATLDRHLGSQGYHLRISDTDILVCQPQLGRLSGQAVCLRALHEIFSHFLGQGEQADIGVHEVVSVSPQGVEAKRVDARAVYESEDDDTRGAGPGGPSPRDKSGAGLVDIWTPFVASNGRRVAVSCALAPICVPKGITIGLRFARRVSDAGSGVAFDSSEIARLSRSDRLRIDLGGIVQALNAVRHEPERSRPLTLIIPISFSSLSNLDDRAQIVTAVKAARSYAVKGVICELCDIDGVPPATLFSAVGAIRPFSLFVIGHLTQLTTAAGRALREGGLRGVSLERPPGLGEAAFIGWAKAAVATAKRTVNSILFYGLESERERQIAFALGATHAHLLDEDEPTAPALPEDLARSNSARARLIREADLPG